MYYNKVEICGVNTSKLKTLSDKEKKELSPDSSCILCAYESGIS